jgi:hypothetical protein
LAADANANARKLQTVLAEVDFVRRKQTDPTTKPEDNASKRAGPSTGSFQPLPLHWTGRATTDHQMSNNAADAPLEAIAVPDSSLLGAAPSIGSK